MRTTLTCLVLICAGLTISTLPVLGQEKDLGPETINLVERFEIPRTTQPPVILDHRLHQQVMDEECTACHTSEEGGTEIKYEIKQLTGVRNDFHATFCWPCHEEMDTGVGKSCSTCHVRK